MQLHLLKFNCHCFNDFLHFRIFCAFLGSFQTTLLCIVGELAEGGSVAVADGISDK